VQFTSPSLSDRLLLSPYRRVENIFPGTQEDRRIITLHHSNEHNFLEVQTFDDELSQFSLEKTMSAETVESLAENIRPQDGMLFIVV
jgi:hypothetical protein